MVVESLLARIARQSGARLLDKAIGRIDAAGPAKKPGLAGKIAGAALVRIATRSVPGAIIVTGGLIAKTLYDKRRAKRQAGAGTTADHGASLLTPLEPADKAKTP